jgi:short-chain fatty acids transporter
MGLMQYSGLADLISEVFVNISTSTTLPLWTFLSGGIVNFFIPSGGGQWVVQGPIMLKAAKSLGADPAKISMALAWGDAWTNLVQPFWALPILALAKLQLKDIMGYCLVFTFFSGLVISLLFLWA